MKSFKHIGRLKGTGSKVLVVFRTLPGESDHALVLPTGNISPGDHDTIMSMVETQQAQEAYELGEIMFIRQFSDGRRMLIACQNDGSLRRVPTDEVIMTPNTKDEILLSDLNVLIAEQKNCAVDDLYTFVKGAVKVQEVAQAKELGEPSVPEYDDNPAAKTIAAPNDEPLSDADIAKGYRSQADAMFKEAQRLRKEAEALDPKPIRKAAAKPKGTPKAANPAKAGKAKAASNAKKAKTAKAEVSD